MTGYSRIALLFPFMTIAMVNANEHDTGVPETILELQQYRQTSAIQMNPEVEERASQPWST